MRVIIILISIFLFSCKTTEIVNQNFQGKPVVSLISDAETYPVASTEDAADDPCIWINPKDILKSTIIATDKKRGIEVYNLDGEKLYSYKLGRINNIDIRDGFLLNGTKISVVTATNRTDNTIAILAVKPNGQLQEISSRPIVSNLKEVYGLAMYKSAKTGKIYTFIVSKKGRVEQWELFENGLKIDAKLVRTINVGGKCEGMVADDYYAKIYIAQEDKALWKYNAEPYSDQKRIKIVGTKDPNMKDDFEGVTLYDAGQGRGHIILSSQGNNSYAVFDRITNLYQGSFLLKDGQTIDGTNDTDGIDVTNLSFGKKYPRGFFIAQDGANTKGKDSLNQNFKIIDWNKIDKGLKLNR